MNSNFTPCNATIRPLIEMFNVCPDTNAVYNNPDVARSVIRKGLEKGYLIHPNCANTYADAFLSTIDMKYNSTFYKTWSDVENKSRMELLIDQLIHYMSTYGTCFMGNAYVPNVYEGEPEWTTYKVISNITYTDLFDKCYDMLCSGIALKSATVKTLCEYIIEWCEFTGEPSHYPNLDKIKNREAMVVLSDRLGILPRDGQKLFAFLVYKATGETMIIKNRAMRNLIKYNLSKIDEMFLTLNDKQLIALAGVYNRYKELFLAMKNQYTRTTINKIARLSKKHHKPMVRGYWENILNMPIDEIMNTIGSHLDEVTNFKLIQVIQAIMERLNNDSNENMYLVRNGKVFVKETDTSVSYNKSVQLGMLYNICRGKLIDNLSKKKCAVKFPEYYELTCPTSEKNFIGNFPMGTSCKLSKESVIGIYWRNDWGTRDFDLSYEGIDGTRIGWNHDFKSGNNNVIFSGDMTDAPNGANEVIKFVSDDIVNGIVNINRYNGQPGSKYRLFFGIDTRKDPFNKTMTKYMVDPNNIQLEAEMNQGEMSQQALGIILNGRFYFFDMSCGYSAVKTAVRISKMRSDGINKYNDPGYWNWYSNGGDIAGQDGLIEILSRKTRSLLPLKQTLLDAGFWEATEDDIDVLDLTNIDRNTIIDLFSKV